MAEKTKKTEANAAETSEKPKKKEPRRKPLWLCIPTEFESFVDDNGDMTTRPKAYEIWECHSKADAHRIIVSKQLDVTSQTVSHIKMFRADPLPLKISAQVTIKF